MKKIELTKGKFALVDDINFDYLNQWKWHFHSGYAVRDEWVNGKSRHIYMHRQLMGLVRGDGKLVDHIDRNALNNRRPNLRICDKSLNALNSKTPVQNTSGIKHISYNRIKRTWRYAIKVQGKQYSLNYQTKVEAIEGLKIKKQELCLNFL